ncbi:hypothetical protein MO973_29995 [Paenibacillus sp. TRM 82003]|nr:hypothetical protein [Kineococcus sp. TRM81007]MCI2239036.1 hypothetical protein [Kineococcus sp. TRM81007]MCI3924456.1 hypothetical protein [Paenibacillus sp. TRM 82003]
MARGCVDAHSWFVLLVADVALVDSAPVALAGEFTTTARDEPERPSC